MIRTHIVVRVELKRHADQRRKRIRSGGLKGGFLYGTFTLSNSGVISGHVTGGTGAYRGDRGTIRGQGENNGANVTVTYWR